MGITMKITNLHSPHRIGIENEDCVFFYTYQITIIKFDIKHALCIVTLTYDMKSAVASSLFLFVHMSMRQNSESASVVYSSRYAVCGGHTANTNTISCDCGIEK